MKRSFSVPILLAGLILAGAGCASTTTETPSTSETPSSSSPSSSSSSTPTPPEPTTPPTPSESTSATSFPLRDKAERFINENQGKSRDAGNFETIVDLVVTDPVEADVYYLV